MPRAVPIRSVVAGHVHLNPQSYIMKKLILLVSALSVASLSYAGAGCGGCTGEKKPADTAPTEKAPEAPKS